VPREATGSAEVEIVEVDDVEDDMA
jgi:hypothetical protein